MATNDVEKDFKALIKNEALGHAYILYGGALTGELDVAQSLANYLETKAWEPSSKILMDARVIDGTQQNLGVDVAREFSEFLYRQPVASPRRTLIVHAAGELTPQAQNALLKIAEEPPSHALIILTVTDLNTILPALLSRFQKIHIPNSGGKESLSSAQTEAKELVEKFLLSNERGRSEIIKTMVKDEREIEAKGEKVVDHFVRYLIEELAKKPDENWRALKHLLHRFTMMNDYSTNKRLQLEAVLQFFK